MLSVSTSSSLPPEFSEKNYFAPVIQISTSKSIYRPGDVVEAAIDIDNFGLLRQKCDEMAELYGDDFDNGSISDFGSILGHPPGLAEAILIEDLTVEIKGVEKLDLTWVKLPRGSSFATHKKGERVFLESPSKSIAKDLLIEFGENRSFMITTLPLPPVLPPWYRGTAVKYHYFITVTCRWSPVLVTAVQVTLGGKAMKAPKPIELKVPLKVWTLPCSSGLTEEELGAADHYGPDGIIPNPPFFLDFRFSESMDNKRWLSAPGSSTSGRIEDEFEFEEAESEPSSSNHHPGNNVEASILQPPQPNSQQEQTAASDTVQNLVAVRGESAPLSSLHAGDARLFNGSEGSSRVNGQHKEGSSFASADSNGDDDPDSPVDSLSNWRSLSASGRTYNLRMDDNILVKFTPRKALQTYCLGDTVSGTLAFPQAPGSRKCLAVSVLLETHEVINPLILHPSRRPKGGLRASAPATAPPGPYARAAGNGGSEWPWQSSACVTAHSHHHEITCDTISTHFLFTIPVDAPHAFATPLLSLQWALRFEFVASQRPSADLAQEDLASLAEGSERGAWSLPIEVHAPPKRSHPTGVTGQVAVSRSRGERFRKPFLSRGERPVAARQVEDSLRGSVQFSRRPSEQEHVGDLRSSWPPGGRGSTKVTRVLDFSHVDSVEE